MEFIPLRTNKKRKPAVSEDTNLKKAKNDKKTDVKGNQSDVEKTKGKKLNSQTPKAKKQSQLEKTKVKKLTAQEKKTKKQADVEKSKAKKLNNVALKAKKVLKGKSQSPAKKNVIKDSPSKKGKIKETPVKKIRSKKKLQKMKSMLRNETEKDDDDENELDASVEETEEEDNEDAIKLPSEERCKLMDEKKKNRLFVKMKRKITSEAEIKELHPDVLGVIFPRKKKSRWCWAVFASEEKADKALIQLKKNPVCLVTKPTPYAKAQLRKQQKRKTFPGKKEAQKKIAQMWL